mgnify:CR=1 FL=1
MLSNSRVTQLTRLGENMRGKKSRYRKRRNAAFLIFSLKLKQHFRNFDTVLFFVAQWRIARGKISHS